VLERPVLDRAPFRQRPLDAEAHPVAYAAVVIDNGRIGQYAPSEPALDADAALVGIAVVETLGVQQVTGKRALPPACTHLAGTGARRPDCASDATNDRQRESRLLRASCLGLS
jgi:hypothetical protein